MSARCKYFPTGRFSASALCVTKLQYRAPLLPCNKLRRRNDNGPLIYKRKAESTHTFLNKYLLARLLARQHTLKSNRQNAHTHTHTNVSRLKQHTRERREGIIYTKPCASTCRDAKAKPSSGVFIIVKLRL